MRNILLLYLVLFQHCCLAQKSGKEKIDSLLDRLSATSNDSTKVRLYGKIIVEHYKMNSTEGLKYEKPALGIAQKIGWKLAIAGIKKGIGRIHWRAGHFEEARKYHFEALSIYDELGDSARVATVLSDIGQDYADGGDYPAALNYFSKALRKYQLLGDKESIAAIYFLFAWVYEKQGDYARTLQANLQAMRLEEEIGDYGGIGVGMGCMAENLRKLGNYPEAIKYSLKAIKVYHETGDKINEAGTHNTLASIYFDLKDYKEAIRNYTLATDIARSANAQIELGSAFSGIGGAHQAQGELAPALQAYLAAADAFRSVSEKQSLCAVYADIAICYTRLGQLADAKQYVDKALALSGYLDSKIPLNDYYRSAELLDSATGNWKAAYRHYKYYIVGRDSTFTQENIKKMLSVQLQYEFEKKEAATQAEQEKKDALAVKELQKQKLIRNSFVGGFAGMLLFAGLFFYQRNKIKKAKRRSDELLLNILPGEVAEELKEKGSADARQFDQVTVLFTDFKDFTLASEHLSAQELVNEINYYYSEFDKIIQRYGIEKIKTIGDAYMCAGGLPVPNKTNPEDTLYAAIEIRDFMLRERQRREAAGKNFFELRIGLHTGPVVAGIVGIKKFAYDIWGDTVNIAARVESGSEPGKINISGATYELVKDKFHCVHRGKIQAKNKGEIDMYFVEGVKTIDQAFA